MHRRLRDNVPPRDCVVDLSEARIRRRRRNEARPSRPARRGSPWKPIALLGLVALAAIAGREGLLPLHTRDGLAAFDDGQPIRAAISVSSGRADCRLLRVIDGDTVDLDCPGDGFVRTRLLGFDTPEVASPECASEATLGHAATRALHRRIAASAEMRVEFRGSDHYGRRLARLSLDGQDIAQPMIAEGLARSYHGGSRWPWCP
jgi:endonuclease YncB( thermonuclease family)